MMSDGLGSQSTNHWRPIRRGMYYTPLLVVACRRQDTRDGLRMAMLSAGVHFFTNLIMVLNFGIAENSLPLFNLKPRSSSPLTICGRRSGTLIAPWNAHCEIHTAWITLCDERRGDQIGCRDLLFY